MAIRDNKDYIRVLLYFYYATITGWGVLLRCCACRVGGGCQRRYRCCAARPPGAEPHLYVLDSFTKKAFEVIATSMYTCHMQSVMPDYPLSTNVFLGWSGTAEATFPA